MSEFSVGDRVIVVRYTADISNEAKTFIVNQPGTVYKVTPEGVFVETDNEVVGVSHWAFYENELEALL